MAIVTNAGTCLRWLDDAQLNPALARRAAERIVRDGHRVGDIVASLRAMARRSTPKMERIDLEHVIRDVLDLLGSELRRRGGEARLEFSRGPKPILGDPTQLQQVVVNLIINALDAMSNLRTGRRRLTIRTLVADGCAQASVVDGGVGLSSDDRDRVFDAFFSTKPEGVGMGLSICRSIVEAHGGRIWVSDNVPHGSVFSFALPLAGGSDGDARPR